MWKPPWKGSSPRRKRPTAGRAWRCLVFAFSRDKLAEAVANRVGQCVLTCPTTACYNGIEDCPREKQIPVGGRLRFFGDGFQMSKKLGPRRFWRLPVMDGEFVCEDRFGTVKGVAGGNLLFCGRFAGIRPSSGRSRRPSHANAAGHHPAVSRRDRAERQQGGIEIQSPQSQHERCLLPHHPPAHQNRDSRPRPRRFMKS